MYREKKGEVVLLVVLLFVLLRSLIAPVSATNLNSSSCEFNVIENSILIENMSCSGVTPNGLFVGRGNISIDCQGFFIVGDGFAGAYGISDNGLRDNVNITNCNIFRFQTGIRIDDTNNHNWTIHNTNISGSRDGIYVVDTRDHHINQTTIINSSRYGFFAETINGATGANITNSNISNSSTYNIYVSEGTTNHLHVHLSGSQVEGHVLYTTDTLGDDFSLVYDNNFYNSTLINSSSAGIQFNRSSQLRTNIMGGLTTGGNFYVGYTGTDTNDDGIGETAFSPNGTAEQNDSLPLVRVYQYTAPNDTIASTLTANSTFNLTNAMVNGSNHSTSQNIIFMNHTDNRRYLQLQVWFNATTDFSNLSIYANESAVAVNLTTVNNYTYNVSHVLFLNNSNRGNGVIVCPDAQDLAGVASTCSNAIVFLPANISAGQYVNNVRVSYVPNDTYMIENVTGTGAVLASNASLVIWDETETDSSPFSGLTRYTNQSITFFANYTNLNGSTINTTESNCTIFFHEDGNSNRMNYNLSSGVYAWNRTYAVGSTYSWNVTCSERFHDTTTTNDTVVIAPGCGILNQSTTLIANVSVGAVTVPGVSSSGSCFIVNASHIILDGDGYNLSGNSSLFGINISDGRRNVTVQHFLTINNFSRGIEITDSVNITIFNNTIDLSNVTSSTGIFFSEAGNNSNVSSNRITAHGAVIDMATSDNNLFRSNIFTSAGTTVTINFALASHHIFHSNNMTARTANVLSIGLSSANVTVADSNITTFGNNDAIALSSLQANISGNTITTNGSSADAVDLGTGSSNAVVFSNTINVTGSSSIGVRSDENVNLTIVNNTILILGNLNDGIQLNTVSSSNISYNYINATRDGISLNTVSDNNVLDENSILTNASADDGILVSVSRSNNFTSNHINITSPATATTYSGAGIRFSGGSRSNRVIYTTINATGGSRGIIFTDTTDTNITLDNNNISATIGLAIEHLSSESNNTLTYNNTHGMINWTSTNLTTNITLQVGNTIFLENNTIGLVDTSQTLRLNGTAVITMRGLPYAVTPRLFVAGVRCDLNTTCNISSYDAATGTLIANVSHFSNYTTQAEDTAPTVTFTTPGNGTNYTTGNQNFNATVTDDSDISVVYFHFTNGTFPFNVTAVNNSGNWSASLDLLRLREGEINVTVFANDTGNNINESVNITIRVDRSAPQVTFSNPTNGTNITGTFNINATVDDNATDVSTVTFQIENGTQPFNVSGTNNSGTWGIALLTTRATEGTHVVRVYANDTINSTFSNVNSTVNISVTIDYTAPNVTFDGPTNGTNISGTVNFNATVRDNTTCAATECGAVSSVLFQIENGTQPFNVSGTNNSGSWGIALLTTRAVEGTHVVRVYANDSTNDTANVNSSVNISVTIDYTAPNVTFDGPTNGTNISGTVNFNATIRDNTTCALTECGAVSSVLFQIENGTQPFNDTGVNSSGLWNINLTTTRAIDGTHVIRIYANDSTNNSANVNSTVNISVTIDNMIPMVTIVSPPNASNLTAGSQHALLQDFNVTINDNGTAVTDVIFRFSNGSDAGTFNVSASNSSGTWNVSRFNLSRLVEGPHNVTVFANDTIGNINESINISINFDNQSPLIFALEVLSITQTGGNLFLNATDLNVSSTGVENCTFTGANSGTLFNNSGLWNFSLTGLNANTQYTVTATCTDFAGNAAGNNTIFTTSSAAGDSGSSSSSGGGGGGGGRSYCVRGYKEVNGTCIREVEDVSKEETEEAVEEEKEAIGGEEIMDGIEGGEPATGKKEGRLPLTGKAFFSDLADLMKGDVPYWVGVSALIILLLIGIVSPFLRKEYRTHVVLPPEEALPPALFVGKAREPPLPWGKKPNLLLDAELDHVNEALRGIRAAPEMLPVRTAARRPQYLQTARDQQLEQELRSVSSQIGGFARGKKISAGRKELDEELTDIEKELSKEGVLPKHKGVIVTVPSSTRGHSPWFPPQRLRSLSSGTQQKVVGAKSVSARSRQHSQQHKEELARIDQELAHLRESPTTWRTVVMEAGNKIGGRLASFRKEWSKPRRKL